jgi:hypothetical protein
LDFREGHAGGGFFVTLSTFIATLAQAADGIPDEQPMAILRHLTDHPKGLRAAQAIFANRAFLATTADIREALTTSLAAEGYWFNPWGLREFALWDPARHAPLTEFMDGVIGYIVTTIEAALIKERIDERPSTAVTKRMRRPATHRERIILEHLERKGLDYVKAVTVDGLRTPGSWQDRGCPSKYTDAYKDPNWRQSIQKEKSKVTARRTRLLARASKSS